MNKKLGLVLLVTSITLWIYVNYGLFMIYNLHPLDVDFVFFLFFDLLAVWQFYYILKHLKKEQG